MRSAYVAGAAVAAVQASSVVIVGQVTTDAVALPVWEGNSTTAWAAQPSVTELSTINTTGMHHLLAATCLRCFADLHAQS